MDAHNVMSRSLVTLQLGDVSDDSGSRSPVRLHEPSQEDASKARRAGTITDVGCLHYVWRRCPCTHVLTGCGDREEGPRLSQYIRRKHPIRKDQARPPVEHQQEAPRGNNDKDFKNGKNWCNSTSRRYTMGCHYTLMPSIRVRLY